MKYIHAQLRGGLGNQLFIYAHAKSIALAQNRKLVLDIYSGFAKDKMYKRSYELAKFDISPDFIIEDDSSLFSRKLLKKVSIILSKFLARKLKFFLYETSLAFNPLLVGCGSGQKHLYIDGYWQSEKYFDNYKEVIFAELRSLLNGIEHFENITSAMTFDNSVSVHVRKFVDDASGFANNLDVEYYKRAFEVIEHKIVSPVYYIFSELGAIRDDIKDYFVTKNCIFVSDLSDNLTSEVDFYLMTRCTHHIIANSTFSWWAAWVGEQGTSESIIVAPKIYIDNGPASWGFEGLIPQRWVQR